jgi:hypothetical protein
MGAYFEICALIGAWPGSLIGNQPGSFFTPKVSSMLPLPNKKVGKMMAEMDSTQIVMLVKKIVEEHGCKLVDIDLEKHILNIEGPKDAQVKCAIALEDALG